jgi:hypothetical protein
MEKLGQMMLQRDVMFGYEIGLDARAAANPGEINDRTSLRRPSQPAYPSFYMQGIMDDWPQTLAELIEGKPFSLGLPMNIFTT